MSSCSRCADRLKNSGCWYFNKMINNSVHQDHLSMFSVSVEIIPAKMSYSIHCPGRISQTCRGHFYPSKVSASLSKK